MEKLLSVIAILLVLSIGILPFILLLVFNKEEMALGYGIGIMTVLIIIAIGKRLSND